MNNPLAPWIAINHQLDMTYAYILCIIIFLYHIQSGDIRGHVCSSAIHIINIFEGVLVLLQTCFGSWFRGLVVELSLLLQLVPLHVLVRLVHSFVTVILLLMLQCFVSVIVMLAYAGHGYPSSFLSDRDNILFQTSSEAWPRQNMLNTFLNPLVIKQLCCLTSS